MVEQKYTPVAAISIETKCAVLEDGRVCEFANMYDVDGEETDDTSVAVTAVAPHPDGPWIVLHLTGLSELTLH